MVYTSVAVLLAYVAQSPGKVSSTAQTPPTGNFLDL